MHEHTPKLKVFSFPFGGGYITVAYRVADRVPDPIEMTDADRPDEDDSVRLYLVTSSVAYCSPRDTFDPEVGRRLASEREADTYSDHGYADAVALFANDDERSLRRAVALSAIDRDIAPSWVRRVLAGLPQ